MAFISKNKATFVQIQVCLIYPTDVNECEVIINPCHRNASCVNAIGTYYCRCNFGYNGNGFDCGMCTLFCIEVAIQEIFICV